MPFSTSPSSAIDDMSMALNSADLLDLSQYIMEQPSQWPLPQHIILTKYQKYNFSSVDITQISKCWP